MSWVTVWGELVSCIMHLFIYCLHFIVRQVCVWHLQSKLIASDVIFSIFVLFKTILCTFLFYGNNAIFRGPWCALRCLVLPCVVLCCLTTTAFVCFSLCTIHPLHPHLLHHHPPPSPPPSIPSLTSLHIFICPPRAEKWAKKFLSQVQFGIEERGEKVFTFNPRWQKNMTWKAEEWH